MCSVSFFFFKQKTAYEMRISDWSSDVCSSDLGGKAKVGPDDPPIGAGARDPLQIDALGFGDARGKRADLDPVGQARARQARLQDRKSVGSGKSVSVRVDLGGRRIIKKKKH